MLNIRRCRRAVRVIAAALGGLLLVLAAGSLGGCTALFATEWSAERLTYQNAPFRAEVEGTLNGVAFRGLLETSFGPDTDAETGTPVLVHSLTYAEPPALAGITVSDAAGGATLSDGSTLQGNAPTPDVSGWLLPVTAFALRGTLYPTEEERGSDSESESTDSTVLRTEQDGRVYTLYLSRETDRPSRIVAETPGGETVLDLHIVWFDDSGSAEGGK